MIFEYFTTLSSLLLDTGQGQAALDAAEEAIIGQIPEPKWHSIILVQLTLIGVAEMRLGRLREAREHLTKALNVAAGNLPRNDPDTLRVMNNLALTLSEQ